MLDIIYNNDTAVAKALYILELVTRENNQINDLKDNENITAREMDLGNEGNDQLSLNLSSSYNIFNVHNVILNKSFLWNYLHITQITFLTKEKNPLKID